MRHLYIDCSFISTTKLNTGIQRVVRSVLANIQEVTKDSDFMPMEVVLEAGKIVQIVKTADGYKKLSSITPSKDDILLLIDSTWHLDTWESILFAKMRETKIIAVVYDIIPISHPKFCDTNLVRLFGKWFDTAIDFIDGFITISKTVQDSLHLYLSEQYPQKTRTIEFDHFLLGANFNREKIQKTEINAKLQNLYKNSKDIYLIVSTIEPRKNHSYLLAVFERLWSQKIDITLVLVGKIGWKVDNLMDSIYSHPEFDKRLFHFEGLSDWELDFCYKSSKMLLFPSYIEGFGLPIIESLSRRLPVLASDTPIHREVGKDKIGYFDINSSNSLFAWIETIQKEGIPKELIVDKEYRWLNWQESTDMLFQKVKDMDKKIQIDTKELDTLIQKIKQKTRQKIKTDKKEDNFVYKEIYEYSDFTQYHDIEFIKILYRVLLAREADQQGLEHHLSLLREGVKSKTEIISMIRDSQEGKRVAVKLLGFNKRRFLTRLNNRSFISYITKSLLFLATLPKQQKRLNMLEATLFMKDMHYQNRYQELINRADAIRTSLTNLKFKLRSDFTNALNKEIETISQFINRSQLQLESSMDMLEQNLDDKCDKAESTALYEELSKRRDYIIECASTLSSTVSNDKTCEYDRFSYLYKDFEDHLRGESEEIKRRLLVYLPFISSLMPKKEDISILDIGSGRGEWLELLKEHGFTKQKGIDINTQMVDYTQKRGLDISQADAITYLKAQPQDSLMAITGFHIIEHISFESLLELLELAYKALKLGGIIIFETPNPRNILVGSSDFYLDPTHNKPLHPISLKFFAKKLGFYDAKSLVVQEDTLKEIDDIAFMKLDDYVTIGRDFALVGRKS